MFREIFGLAEEVHKTQALEFEADGIDSPGEFFSYPRLYYALINTASDVDTLVYVHPANERNFRMPPGLLEIYADRQVVAVITKTDLPDADPEFVESMLRENGISGPVFRVTIGDATAYDKVRKYLLADKGAGI